MTKVEVSITLNVTKVSAIMFIQRADTLLRRR
jgi:hypothetical protein